MCTDTSQGGSKKEVNVGSMVEINILYKLGIA